MRQLKQKQNIASTKKGAESKNDNKKKRNCLYFCSLVSFGVVFCFTGFAALVGLLVLKEDDENITTMMQASTFSPSNIPPPTLKKPLDIVFVTNEIESHLGKIYSNNNFLSPLRDENSHQSKALEWILYNDPLRKKDFWNRFLLANFFLCFKGFKWKNHSFWLSGADECTWYGIHCQLRNGIKEIVEINLDSNRLEGTLPFEIGLFPFLETLSLAQNPNLKGSIPSSMGMLENIQEIDLWSNDLTGTLPSTIGQLGDLKFLSLDQNQLQGSLPLQIGNMTSLEDLTLAGNSFEGIIPTDISRLKQINRLWLSDNLFTGYFPLAFFDLPKLAYLYLDGNQFHGQIPSHFSDNIVDIRVGKNLFSGCLPLELFQIAKLEILYLNENQFSCELFPEIYNAPSLRELDLDFNLFYGTIPEFSGNSSLVRISFSSNQLSSSIPKNITNLKTLEVLSLNNNSFTGFIPNSIANLTKLQYLRLSENQLTGNIPIELGNLTNLHQLTLHNNKIRGTIPVCNTSSISYITADCKGKNAKVKCSCCMMCQ